MKSINLMTINEIKSKFSTEEILDLIVKFTKEADKYKQAVRFASNEFIAETQSDLYNLTISKVRKLESIAY